jgi:hypothetical protein
MKERLIGFMLGALLVLVLGGVGVAVFVGSNASDYDCEETFPRSASIAQDNIFVDGYFLEIGDVIENINDGDVNVVVDVIESFDGHVVYVLDDGHRRSESLIKKYWRIAPEPDEIKECGCSEYEEE